jgi:ABC-type taurine transport system ATPase subunit
MITESIPKEELYDSEGRYRSHNLERTIVTMTRDEAILLVCDLVRMLGTPGKFDLGCRPFADGLWEEKRLSFTVVDEPTFVKYRQELRDELLPKK